jgi:adenylate kinase family enzyme
MSIDTNFKLGNKILIIGCAGSGKTTLAKKLSRILNLPLIHLDNYYWAPGWQSVPQQLWQSRLDDLIEKPKWIMDGNYTQSLAKRLVEATAVIYLDMPRYKCLWRAFRRRLKLGVKRDDIPKDCIDRLSFSFYLWIWNYPKRARQRTLDLISGFNGAVYILKNNKQIKDWFLEITESNKNG